MRLSYPFVICWITFLLAFSSTKAQSYFRIKQQVIQYWSGTWENYERLTFSYDSAGNLSGKIKDVFTLNTSSGSWNLYSRENTLFDSLHRPVQATTQLYSNSNWNNYFQLNYAYDSLGNQIMKTSANWINNNWSIQLGEKRNFTFQNNLPDSIRIETWNNNTSSFENQKLFIWNYSGNSPVSAQIYQWNNGWNPIQNLQALSFLNPYSTGDFMQWYNDNRTSYELYQIVSGNFVGLEKANFSWANPGKPNLEVYQRFTNGLWLDSLKNEYDYYTSNGRIKEIRNFSQVNNSWYQYNGTHTNYTDNAQGDIDYQIELDFQNQSWENQKKIIYTYELQTGIEVEKSPPYLVYPNPATDLLFLPETNSSSNWVVYNILGQNFELSKADHGILSISSLSPGIYFLSHPQLNYAIRFVKQ